MLLSSSALCSIDDVRAYLYGTTGNEKLDRVIALMINGLSVAFEAATGRKILRTQRVEEFNSPQHVVQLSYRVEAPPIVPGSVTLKYSPTRDFVGNVTTYTENKEYVVDYNNGIISVVMPAFWGVGWGDPMRPIAYNTSSDLYGFPRETHSLQVTYFGGLVVPRPPQPQLPLHSLGAGSLSGKYLYSFSVVDSGGIESASTRPFLQLDLSSQQVTFTFPDPGAGKKYVVYRSPANTDDLFFLAEVNGPWPATYVDNNADSALNSTRLPFSPGPLEVPDDLRLAAAQQVADWVNRGGSVTTVAVSGPLGLGSRQYDGSKFTSFMQEMIVAYRILRT